MTVHSERRHLPYDRTRLFDLVADVERYPEFLPWMLSANIVRREGDEVWVDMDVGLKGIRRHVASHAVLHRPQRIDIDSTDRMFRHLEQHWKLAPWEKHGTLVEFIANFEFRSPVLQLVAGAILDRMAASTVDSFERRARAILGRDYAGR